MCFIKQGKTNWKYILIVVILAVIIAGGIFAWQHWSVPEEKGEAPERKVVVPSSEKDCQILKEPFYRNYCYIDLAKKTKNESYCEKIEALPGGTIEETRAMHGVNCYIQLAVLKNDPTLCEKAELYEEWNKEFSNWCKTYFEGPSDFRIYGSEKYEFEVTYPKDWKCDEITLGQGGYFYQNGISCEKITDVDGIRIWVLKSEPPYYFEKEKVTFEEYIAKEKQKIEKEWGSFKEEEIVLDNLPAIKLTFESTDVTHYLTKYKTKSYKVFAQKAGNMYIVGGTIDFSKLDIYNPAFDQMISTFKFLEVK